MMTEMGSSVSCKWDVKVPSGLNTDKSWTLVSDDMKSEERLELQTRAA
jgi:hypothetical protein